MHIIFPLCYIHPQVNQHRFNLLYILSTKYEKGARKIQPLGPGFPHTARRFFRTPSGLHPRRRFWQPGSPRSLGAGFAQAFCRVITTMKRLGVTEASLLLGSPCHWGDGKARSRFWVAWCWRERWVLYNVRAKVHGILYNADYQFSQVEKIQYSYL